LRIKEQATRLTPFFDHDDDDDDDDDDGILSTNFNVFNNPTMFSSI